MDRIIKVWAQLDHDEALHLGSVTYDTARDDAEGTLVCLAEMLREIADLLQYGEKRGNEDGTNEHS